jgi:hypothetical protein
VISTMKLMLALEEDPSDEALAKALDDRRRSMALAREPWQTMTELSREQAAKRAARGPSL